MRILTPTVVSPSLAHQLQQTLEHYPAARWHVYEPVGRENSPAGQARFGDDVDVQYRFDKADVILALDADFLAQGPGHVRHAREFSNRRRVRAERRMLRARRA